MSCSNQKIALILRAMADHLEIHLDNPYRIRAYRRAARRIEGLEEELIVLEKKGFDLTAVPNIGKGLAAQIKLICKTGKIPTLFKKKIKNKFYNELKEIEGLGPKRISILNKQFGIKTKKELRLAINRGKLNACVWFNKSLEKKILYSIEHHVYHEKIYKYKFIEMIVNSIEAFFQKIAFTGMKIITGDYRRKSEKSGDIIVLIQTRNMENIIDLFLQFNVIKAIIKRTKRSVSLLLISSVKVTLIKVDKKNYGANLLFHTGSFQHVERLKRIAKSKNLELNEKGLYQNKKYLAGKNELEIYKRLDCQYIEPELREDRGEIEASQKNQLPALITLEDIRGDLHAHTTETDGTEPIEIMIKAAIKKGYNYLAITDHSKNLRITNGMDEKRLLQQIKLIDKLNNQLDDFVVLKGIEVDILENGELDLSNDVLKELDLRVCSIHSKFKLSLEKQTERIIRAMDNPFFNILGHATGRLLMSRPPYPIDVEKILTAAKDRHCFIELNAQPSRLDINDEYCLLAKQLGVKIAISSDAHSISELNFMKYGINQARRGWLEKSDVINTHSLIDLQKLLKK